MGDKVKMGSNDNSNLEGMRIVPATNSPAPKAPSRQIGVNNKSIVVLRVQSRLLDEDIEAIEVKYSEKFGCKVVVLEANLYFVDVIDG